MESHFTSTNLVTRVVWAYTTYIGLVLISFALGYIFLPRGVLLNTPWTAFGSMAASPESFIEQFLVTVLFNLGFVFLLGVALNLQRVNGFPTGYVFVFAAELLADWWREQTRLYHK